MEIMSNCLALFKRGRKVCEIENSKKNSAQHMRQRKRIKTETRAIHEVYHCLIYNY